MEYLDALLSAGRCSASRRRPAGSPAPIRARTGQPAPAHRPDAPTEPSPAAAETVAVAAGDLLLGELFGRLSAGAHRACSSARRSTARRSAATCCCSRRPVQPGRADRAGRRLRGHRPAGRRRQPRAARRCSCTGGPPANCTAGWTRPSEATRSPTRTAGPPNTGGWRITRLAARPARRARGQLPPASGRRPARSRIRPAPRAHGRCGRGGAARWLGLVDRRGGRDRHSWPPGRPGLFSARHLVLTRAGAPAQPARRRAARRRRCATRRRPGWPSRSAAARSWPATRRCAPRLQAHGIAAGNLLVLRPATPDPLGSDVVMATAAVRSQFGGRLASVYAPGGHGQLRLRRAADRRARRRAGRGRRLPDRAGLGPGRPPGQPGASCCRTRGSASRRPPGANWPRGQVDPRLLITLAALAAAEPVRVTAFEDAGPGAGAGMPSAGRRSAAGSAAAGRRGRPAEPCSPLCARSARRICRPGGLVRGAGGSPVLSIEFAAPSPVGLLQTPSAPGTE